MDLLIGLDIGTTAIKGILLSKNGKILKTVSGGYDYYSKGNKKLLDPNGFIEVCFSVIKSLADSKGKNDKVLAICSCCAPWRRARPATWWSRACCRRGWRWKIRVSIPRKI